MAEPVHRVWVGTSGWSDSRDWAQTQHICHKMRLGTSAPLPLPAVMVRSVVGNCRNVTFYSVGPGFPVILMETMVSLN